MNQLLNDISSRLGSRVGGTMNSTTYSKPSSGLASRLGTRVTRPVAERLNAPTSLTIRNKHRQERKADSANARFTLQNRNRPVFDPLECLKTTNNNLRSAKKSFSLLLD